MYSAAALLLLGVAAAPAPAAEIDSVTGRGSPLADSTRALERRLQDALERGVARANRESIGCDPQALYGALRRELARPFVGHVIAAALDEDDSLDRRRIRRSESIYRDLGLLESVSVHWKDLSSVVRAGDVLLGVDKLGHFVVEGWQYFETAELDGGGIDAALGWGERTERTWFGRYTTGIHSYADLVANFEGMRFWHHVLRDGDDPLGRGWWPDRPYVKCVRRYGIAGERRWRLARRLDLDRYLTPVWDEAINCCSYRSDEIEARVRARIAELSEADGVDYTCPIDAAACARARLRYGAWAQRLLHPDCLAAEPPPRPWWRFWR